MNLMELKNAIMEEELGSELIVFVTGGDSFLADQYVQAIAAAKKMPANKITSLAETSAFSALSLVMGYDSKLNVLKTETFDEEYDDYFSFENIVVVCDKLSAKLAKSQELAPYVIKLPKLLEWQIKDYMLLLCPGISEKAIDWLYKATGGNVRRIENELAKAMLYDKTERLYFLSQLAQEQDTDLVIPVISTVFEIPEAILGRDYQTVAKLMRHRELYLPTDSYKVDTGMNAHGLITNMLTTCKLLAMARACGGNYDSLGASSKRAAVIARKYKSMPQARLIETIKFLSSVNMRLKAGELDIPTEYLADYVIATVMTL